ncbi:DUF2269 family protein [Lysinibacillus antri]|uniref:DUF2269 family protein n=1 Tax=Lysinibacillus antri TaxID=2498145 RepID=A0A432L9X3_9BACI|nr:DUF2269 family protein [Lysinibacillus antri]RUL50908.1 DUF2269 family protein [Lysinibacillus antri]
MDILFLLVLVLHILGAICGLGATFASPYIMKGARNVRTATYAHAVNARIEKLAKMGSITLLVTGLIMAIIHPYLFTTGWYIVSIVLYILTQPIVAYFIPKHTKTLVSILATAKDDELPSEYIQVLKKIAPLTVTTQVLLVILVVLMVFKPF